MIEAWKLGNDPETHPLWERQVELELTMVERGAERYRAKEAKARDKEEMTALRPYRRVLEDMVDAMGASVRAWLMGSERVAANKKKAGAKGIAFTKLQGMEPHLLAYITARTVLDGITINKFWLNRTARAVGVQVEYEARMSAWCDRDPGLFNEVQRGLTNQKATAKHRKRVNINKFNKLIRVKQRWRDWSKDEHLHVGLKLLDILARTSGHVSIMRDPAFVPQRSKGKNFGAKSAPYIVVASDELLEYLNESTASDASRTPLYLPTLMPPKRWEGVRSGGYYTPLVRLPRLIRFKADNEEVQGMASEEYDSLDMPGVFSALNKVQEVPWRVNKKVLAIAFEAWERDLGIGKLGKREPLELPPRLEGQRREDLRGPKRKAAEALWQKDNKKAFQEWKREAAKVYGDNARRVSNGMAVRTTLAVAEQFRDDEFYFPHMLDFRGRMYPIPAYLQPQGNDLARGLLTFAWGAPVGEWGLYWLGVHLANCWGNDKISFDERRDWAEENWELWTRIYENPLGNLEWAQRDDPWQSLAAILEYVRVGSSSNPELEVSSLPLRVDGTCNGIQHLSAMMRDDVGGASVNLLPGDAPRDIYGEVAAILQARLEGIRDSGGAEGKMAAKWLKAFGGTIPRKFTKNPVMVTPYGGTRDSFKGSVMEWLQKNNPPAIPDKKGKKYNARFEATLWIVPHLWDAVAGRVVQGQVCMEWLKNCARLVADTGQPIWWTTETGFQIRHFYGARKLRRIKTKVDGKQVYLVDWERTSRLAKKEQLQGIAPNFVHSQDGAVNMETILQFMADPDMPPPFTTIHDAFGTVAGRMWDLFHIIREAFVKVHTGDVLEGFRQRCVMMLRDYYMANREGWKLHRAWEEAEDVMPQVPGRGALDIGAVCEANYFFA